MAFRTYSTDGITPVQQVVAQTWHTKIPVHLSLAPDNISSPAAVRPIYLLAPRQGYLQVVASQAWPHLQHVLPSVPGRPGPPRPWFDCGGVPLKWYLPCGVLYDLAAGGGQLPWRLTVHYTHPPDSLVGWETGATAQAQFMNSLKEACYICRGGEGSGAVMRMGSAAQDELWSAVQSGDVLSYRAVLEGLKIVPTGRQGQPPNIPVRLLLRRATHASTASPAPAGAASTAGSAPAATASRTASGEGAAAAAGPPSSSTSSSTHGAAAAACATPGSASIIAGGGPGGGGAGGGPGGGGAGGGGGALWESSVLSTSRPVPALRGGSGGEPTTLGHLLHMLLPHIFPQPPASQPSPHPPGFLNATAAATAAASGGGPPAVEPSSESVAAAVPSATVGGAGASAPNRGPCGGGSGGGSGGGGGGGGGGSGGGGGGGGRGGGGGGSRGEGGGEGAGGGEGGGGSLAAEAESTGLMAREEGEAGLCEPSAADAGLSGAAAHGALPVTTSGRGAAAAGSAPTAGAGPGVGAGAPGVERALGERGGGADGCGGAEEAAGGAQEGAAARPEEAGDVASGASPSRDDAIQPADPEAGTVTATAAATAAKVAAGAGQVAVGAGRGAGPGGGRTGCGGGGSGSRESPLWPPCRVIVGGICPPLAAPLAWLHAAMHSPDLFLYVVVRMDLEPS